MPNKSLKGAPVGRWTAPVGACFAFYAPPVPAP